MKYNFTAPFINKIRLGLSLKKTQHPVVQTAALAF